MWQEFFRHLKTTLNIATSRHHETDGQTERTIRTIEQYICTYVSYDQDNWDLHGPYAEFAYNSAHHSTTSLSPFQVNGRQPLTPLALLGYGNDCRDPAAKKLLDEAADVITTCQAHLHELNYVTAKPGPDTPTEIERLAAKNIRASQTRACKYFNQHRRPSTFQVGQRVLISTKDLKLPQFTSRGNWALSNRYIGPYTIIPNPKPTPDSFTVRLPGHSTMHRTFHSSLLRPYYEPSSFPLRPSIPALTSAFPPNKKLPIDSILARKYINGSIHYQVKWKGSDTTAWVPYQSLENAHHLILEWEDLQKP
jgi:hypothetical protein